MTTPFAIDPSASEAPYEQLRVQIAQQARDGELPVGHRLPPVRALATELGLATNTVARTYRALEADGVVETRGRHGTFVAAAGAAADRLLAEAAQAYVATARRLGASRTTARDALDDALRASYPAEGADPS